MKKTNLAIVATIIATFFMAMFAFQPIATEASNIVSPAMTPSPRTVGKLPRKSIEVENDETHRTERVSRTKRKAPTSSGDQPEMQRSNSRKPNKTATKKNNNFFDAPKLDADSGLEVVGNQRRTTTKPKVKRSSEKRVHKP
jgi:hypothetical protein